MVVHLNDRDVTLLCMSQAPLDKLVTGADVPGRDATPADAARVAREEEVGP